MRETERHSTHQQTSDQAFAAAPKGAAAEILGFLWSNPSTCDAVMEQLGMIHSTCSSGINKLMRTGWIIDTGIRRKTRAGRLAIVWFPSRIPQPIEDARPTRAQLVEQNAILLTRIKQLETEIAGWQEAHHYDHEFDGTVE